MNHSEALNSNAAEKYLLGELSADERAEYEEHYFGCQECAEDVRAGAALLDNTRQVLRFRFLRKAERAERAVERRWWFPSFRPAYALAAFLLLAAALIYQNLFTIPALRREVAANIPQALPSYSFNTLGSRGSAKVVVQGDPKRPFVFYVDVPASQGFLSYTCRVRSESGTSIFVVGVTAEQARDTVLLLVPGATLHSGSYALIIEGHRAQQGPEAPGKEIARYPFAVQARQ